MGIGGLCCKDALLLGIGWSSLSNEWEGVGKEPKLDPTRRANFVHFSRFSS